MAASSEALSQSKDGRSRWVVVAASFLFVFMLWSPYTGFGVFVPELTEEFGWQRGTIATVFSIIMVIGAPLGLLIGKLMDQYGPKKVAVLEVVCCCASYILASRIQNLSHLYVFLGVLLGIGFAGAYTIPTTTAARWFQENRGLALGIVLSGQGLGYFIGPVLVAGLIEGLGWRNAFLVLGLAVGILGITPALLLRNPSSPSVIQRPGRATADSKASGSTTLASAGASITLRQVIGASTFQQLFLVWVFQAFAQMMFTIHMVPLLVDKGIGLAVAAGALSSYGIGLLSGRLISGPAADRIGARFTFAVAAGIGDLSLGLLLIAQDLTFMYTAALGVGLAVSGADTAYVKALPDIVGASRLGTVLSGLNIGWRVGGSTGPALAGIAFDITHVYALPFGLSILGLLVSIGLFFAATRPERRLDLILEQRSATG